MLYTEVKIYNIPLGVVCAVFVVQSQICLCVNLLNRFMNRHTEGGPYNVNSTILNACAHKNYPYHKIFSISQLSSFNM